MNWLTEAMKDKPPVFVEYRGARWKLNPNTHLAYCLSVLLDKRPLNIAKPEPNDSVFAIAALAQTICDCLEYRYCQFFQRDRGDCPSWRIEALLVLEKWAKIWYDRLHTKAQDPFYDMKKMK